MAVIEEVERGRVDVGLLVGSKIEGWGRFKGRVLALGLFATLSFPLSTLAHLHLCQLNVPQDVGVCDEERRRKCDEWEVERLPHFNHLAHNVYNWESTTTEASMKPSCNQNYLRHHLHVHTR